MAFNYTDRYWLDDPKGDQHEYWYRFDDKRYAVSSGWGDDDYSIVTEIELSRFRVLKHVPCGVWVTGGKHKRRLVKRDARKRFACPTMEEARDSYIARKKKQAAIHYSIAKKAEELIQRISRGWL